MTYHQVMYRAYPKKHSRTFKYHRWTRRSEIKWYKSSRFEKANGKKSTARVLVRQMTEALDEVELEELEAEMLSVISPYTCIGYYD